MRGLFREMSVARMRHRDRLEELTFQAFQTVKVWAITRSKKGRMPKFDSLLPSDGTAMSAAQMRAAMSLIAQQHGGRIRITTTREAT